MNSSPRNHPICFVPPRRIALSAWIEHVPFAMYLVELHRPASIVELGTRNGVSYSAFCQAVHTLGISACCVAVDSWHGDAHTGAYGPKVLRELRLHHDPLYSGFSSLLQRAFDEAAASFSEGSIDLLHIDGFHTYEAAKHDFETWLSKMSSRGVVLFHDVAEHGRDFGVWKLWAELSSRYPAFAFRHGHGLGVLGVGSALPDAVTDLLQLSGAEAQEIRKFFHWQGRRAALGVTVELAARLPGQYIAAAIDFTRKLSPDSAQGG